jgi:hypothetical protein
MSMTFWIGLGMVAVAAAVLGPMMFSEHEPATVEVPAEPTDAHRSQPLRRGPRPDQVPVTVRVPETVSIHPTWWERLRGVAGLLVVTVGLGAAVAVAVGAVVMVVGMTILK